MDPNTPLVVMQLYPIWRCPGCGFPNPCESAESDPEKHAAVIEQMKADLRAEGEDPEQYEFQGPSMTLKAVGECLSCDLKVRIRPPFIGLSPGPIEEDDDAQED